MRWRQLASTASCVGGTGRASSQSPATRYSSADPRAQGVPAEARQAVRESLLPGRREQVGVDQAAVRVLGVAQVEPENLLVGKGEVFRGLDEKVDEQLRPAGGGKPERAGLAAFENDVVALPGSLLQPAGEDGADVVGRGRSFAEHGAQVAAETAVGAVAQGPRVPAAQVAAADERRHDPAGGLRLARAGPLPRPQQRALHPPENAVERPQVVRVAGPFGRGERVGPVGRLQADQPAQQPQGGAPPAAGQAPSLSGSVSGPETPRPRFTSSPRLPPHRTIVGVMGQVRAVERVAPGDLFAPPLQEEQPFQHQLGVAGRAEDGAARLALVMDEPGVRRPDHLQAAPPHRASTGPRRCNPRRTARRSRPPPRTPSAASPGRRRSRR